MLYAADADLLKSSKPLTPLALLQVTGNVVESMEPSEPLVAAFSEPLAVAFVDAAFPVPLVEVFLLSKSSDEMMFLDSLNSSIDNVFAVVVSPMTAES